MTKKRAASKRHAIFLCSEAGLMSKGPDTTACAFPIWAQLCIILRRYAPQRITAYAGSLLTLLRNNRNSSVRKGHFNSQYEILVDYFASILMHHIQIW